MENRKYFDRATKYLAGAALVGSLLLSGCATTQRNTERPLPSHDNKAYENFSRQDEPRKDYEPEKKFFGEAIGRFIGEGLIRLLIP